MLISVASCSSDDSGDEGINPVDPPTAATLIFPENKYISVTEPYAWTFLKNFADKELSNFKIY